LGLYKNTRANDRTIIVAGIFFQIVNHNTPPWKQDYACFIFAVPETL
jgi:hypothetical protein